MEQGKNYFEKTSPSAAEMHDYIINLGEKIKKGGLKGKGWFVSMISNEQGSNNPTVTLSRGDKTGRLVHEIVPWKEFLSWQE